MTIKSQLDQVLAPCPFCGSADVRVFGDKPDESMICGYNVICGNPNCQSTCRHSGDRDKAIAAWNKRAAVGGDKPRCGEEHYELDAYIWRRESTQSWVLELSGCINDTTFITRHSEPLTTKPQDVASLPSLYAVGGEAVAWEVWRNGKVIASLTRPPMVGEVAYDEGETVRALYASPTATVGVGAGKEALAIIDKWMESYDHMGTGTSAVARMSEREWEEDRAKLAALIGEKA